MKFYRIISCCFAFAILFFIAGCKRVAHKRNFLSEQRLIDEARLVDVSLPVGASAYDISKSSEGDIALSFVTDFSEKLLIDFYKLEMERLGWRNISAFSSTEESLLIYEKPHKICAISIRFYTKKRGVFVFVGQKKYENLR